MAGDWRVGATYILAALGAVVTLGILLWMGGLACLMSGFPLWTLLPYLLLAVIARFSASKLFRGLVLAVAFVSIPAGIYFYIDACFIHLDAQGALVFVVIPVYQIFALFVVLGIGGIARALTGGFGGSADAADRVQSTQPRQTPGGAVYPKGE